MTEHPRAHAGDWVEIECLLLDPADRSGNLPDDTAATPLCMWVKGLLQGDAAVGDEATVETATGRRVSGTLSAVNPGYFHTFGEPVPELKDVGRDLRARLAAWRATQGGGDAP